MKNLILCMTLSGLFVTAIGCGASEKKEDSSSTTSVVTKDVKVMVPPSAGIIQEIEITPRDKSGTFRVKDSAYAFRLTGNVGQKYLLNVRTGLGWAVVPDAQVPAFKVFIGDASHELTSMEKSESMTKSEAGFVLRMTEDLPAFDKPAVSSESRAEGTSPSPVVEGPITYERKAEVANKYRAAVAKVNFLQERKAQRELEAETYQQAGQTDAWAVVRDEIVALEARISAQKAVVDELKKLLDEITKKIPDAPAVQPAPAPAAPKPTVAIPSRPVDEKTGKELSGGFKVVVDSNDKITWYYNLADSNGKPGDVWLRWDDAKGWVPSAKPAQ